MHNPTGAKCKSVDECQGSLVTDSGRAIDLSHFTGSLKFDKESDKCVKLKKEPKLEDIGCDDTRQAMCVKDRLCTLDECELGLFLRSATSKASTWANGEALARTRAVRWSFMSIWLKVCYSFHACLLEAKQAKNNQYLAFLQRME